MKKIMLAAACVLTATFAHNTSAHAAPQACVNSLISGLTVRGGCGNNYKARNIKMVSMSRNNVWTSWSEGEATLSSGDARISNMSEYFSDRVVSGKPFAGAVDSKTVVISNANGNVISTSNTWGVTATYSGTSCDGNVIRASDANQVVMITFGALMNRTVIC